MTEVLAENAQHLRVGTVDITAICTVLQVLEGKATDGLTPDDIKGIFPEMREMSAERVVQELGIVIADCRQMGILIILQQLEREFSFQLREVSPQLRELQKFYQLGHQHEQLFEENRKLIFGLSALSAFVTILSESSPTHS